MKLRTAEKKSGRRAVLVHWIDSGGADGWVMDDDGAPGSVEIFTVGWLIQKTRQDLVVSASASSANGKDAQSMAPVAIPRRAIVSWKYLR